MKVIDFSRFNLPQEGEIVASNEEGLIHAAQIDLSKNYPELDFLLERNGVGCFSRGDIQAIKAKAKQGKTTAIVCLEVALFKGSYVGLSAKKDNIRVLHVDTEQNPLNVAKNIRKVHRLCEWNVDLNNERFVVLALREYNVETRKKILEEAIIEFSPDIVFVDGIRDLMLDFNSISESGDVINLIMRLSKTYNTAICAVLHENKADGNMRGHIGSELINKCSDAYQIKKDTGTDIITVEQTDSRNAPIQDWAFSIDNEALPQPAEPILRRSPADQKKAQIRDNMRYLFSKKGEYKHKELAEEYMVASGRKERAAAGHIADALKLGIINQKENGLYVLGLT